MENFFFKIITKFGSPKHKRAAARFYFASQIKKGQLKSAEIEWQQLANWVKEGDFVIDIGANIGRYTLKLSGLVGKTGQVLSLEPMKFAFDYLTYFQSKGFFFNNVILLNIAASNQNGLVNFSVNPGPGNYLFETFTQSKITNFGVETNTDTTLAIQIDSLNLTRKVKLIKIDVEGHELEVLNGMKNLLQVHMPVMIIENLEDNSGIVEFLTEYGYTPTKISDTSRNTVFVVNQ